MDSKNKIINVFFLPYFTSSHLIPMVDLARVFATRGVSATIITTPKNAALFQHSLSSAAGDISVHTFKLPAAEVNLPDGIENFSHCSSAELMYKLGTAIGLLQDPITRFIMEARPDCIVSDMFFPWTVDIACELEIPRILFYPSNSFYHCVSHSLRIHHPHEMVRSESEIFLVPGLPDPIQMMRSQLQDHDKTKTKYGGLIDMIKETELRSYGIVFTSFYEFESDYVEQFRKVRGIKSWHVGLPSNLLIHKDQIRKERENLITQQHYCLNWLDTQKPNSVIYVCFGSMVRFPDTQLTQIALALQASEHPFVWVVRKCGKMKENENENEEKNWLPDGFEEELTITKRGLIIREWAPQVSILGHVSVGGFMTHCGWNSILESVIAGVPLITWPLFAEQFYNEQLITQVLKVGVGVGSGVWNSGYEIKSPVVGSDKVLKAVNCLMGGSEEAKRIRRRAKELGDVAMISMEDGGSAYSDVNGLVEEITALAFSKITHGD